MFLFRRHKNGPFWIQNICGKAKQIWHTWPRKNHNAPLGASHSFWIEALQWRHNGRDGVWNHQPHDCLLNRLFRRISKKISKLRVTGLCAENSPMTNKWPVTRKMFPFDDVIMFIEFVSHDPNNEKYQWTGRGDTAYLLIWALTIMETSFLQSSLQC